MIVCQSDAIWRQFSMKPLIGHGYLGYFVFSVAIDCLILNSFLLTLLSLQWLFKLKVVQTYWSQPTILGGWIPARQVLDNLQPKVEPELSGLVKSTTWAGAHVDSIGWSAAFLKLCIQFFPFKNLCRKPTWRHLLILYLILKCVFEEFWLVSFRVWSNFINFGTIGFWKLD